MTYIINHYDTTSLTIDELIESGIPTFPTKVEALRVGKTIGWNSAIKIERRFEHIWMIGSKDFQDDIEYDLRFEVYRFPLMFFKKRDDGIEYRPVLKVRKFLY